MRRALGYRCGAVLVILLLALGGAAPALGAGGATERASVAPDGAQSNGESFFPTLSADGRFVAFQTAADNLVAGDTNGVTDIFVHDRLTGTTERVSVAFNGVQGDKGSVRAALSADGRYVAFLSDADNLIPSDTNGRTDVFVRDRLNGTTERVDIASDGGQPDFGCTGATALSADGRFVAFASFDANLVPGDTNGQLDVFVRDRVAGATERVSVASDGGQSTSGSGTLALALSADGRFVAFDTVSALAPGDTNGVTDIFVHDRLTGTTARVSVTNDGAQANSASLFPSLSADGRYVAFTSGASNLVPGDTNGFTDVFVRDRLAGTTQRVDVAGDGAQANNGGAQLAALSADGRFVAFQSAASNLVPGDTLPCEDIFVRDLAAGTTERVSVASDGSQANACSGNAALSADGGSVAFLSFASNLVPDDTNGQRDVFVHDRQTLDTAPPTLAVPTAIVVDAASPAGATVAYTATAVDAVDPNPTIACAPPSGSVFAIGVTTVNCLAIDAAGNQASAAFTVAVLGAADQLENMIALVQTFDLKQGIATSLDAKLDAARSALTAMQAGDRSTACNQLGAVIHEAQAQSGKALTAAQANQLIVAAARIQAVLGCG